MNSSSIPFSFFPPSSFNPRVEIVAVWLEKNKKILFLQKTSFSKYAPNKWAPLGGKIEKGENPLEAAIRETKEEVGINLNQEQIQFLATLYVRDPKLDFIYHMYRAIYPNSSTLTLSEEHLAYAWVELEEALELDLMGGVQETISIYRILQAKPNPLSL
jgi:8-oxo-dGTP pyrophosphatase MutT (NUDIX family)